MSDNALREAAAKLLDCLEQHKLADPPKYDGNPIHVVWGAPQSWQDVLEDQRRNAEAAADAAIVHQSYAAHEALAPRRAELVGEIRRLTITLTTPGTKAIGEQEFDAIVQFAVSGESLRRTKAMIAAMKLLGKLSVPPAAPVVSPVPTSAAPTMTADEAADEWGVDRSTVTRYCEFVPGAVKDATGAWLIPCGTRKPKISRRQKAEQPRVIRTPLLWDCLDCGNGPVESATCPAAKCQKCGKRAWSARRKAG